MEYTQRLEIVKEKLIKHCSECVIYNWDTEFNKWLKYQASVEFDIGYTDTIKEQFSNYMDTKMGKILYFASKNIVYSIFTYMECKQTISQTDVLDFIRIFITHQIDDLHHWCGEIAHRMCEEEFEKEQNF
jgi:hypothetical protein